MYQGKRSAFMLLLAGMFVGLIGLVACGGGGGSSSSGGTLPQTSIAPTATLDGWTPNDSTLVQYKTYTFAASATDPNIGGSISEFRWDFGDGTTKTTPVVLSGGKATTTVTYSYVTSGTPTLSVVAKNAAGLLSTAATKSLTVGTSPSPLTVTFVSPKAATLVNAVLGNKVTLTYTVNVVYTGFGTVSASGITLDPGEASATQTAPVDAGSGNYTITVTYSAASAIGSRTVTPSVKVVDSNGVSSTTVLGPAITIKTVSATNTAPIITLTSDAKPSAGPNATWQNVDVVFTAVASDPDSDPLTYTWDLGDGTVVTGSTQLTQTHKYSKAGLYSVKVTADDGRAGGTKTADLTLNVLVNRAPTVVVTKTLPSGNPTKYQRVTLSAAVTDLDSDLPTVTWDFGDGTASATGTSVVHQFQAAGVSTVVATADDGKGGSGSGTLLLTVVENNPPVATVTGPSPAATLFQNKVYTFTATASDLDSGDTIASYEWDFGDKVVVAGGASQTHTFPPTVSGAVLVKARAIDSRGAVGDWSPEVTYLVNTTKLPAVTFTVGDKATFNATSADQVIAEFLVTVTNPNGAAGAYLPLTALTVVAGDAAGTVGTIINHQDGTYTIPVKYLAAAAVGTRSVFPALVALDGLGIASTAVAASATVNTVAALNVTPVATLVSAPKIAAGTNATWTGVDVVFTATGSDPDSDPLVYTWEFGDGTVLTGMLGSAALTQTHNYTTAGNYSVKLTADDGRLNGTKTADLTLSVLANAAPTVVVTKVSPGGNPTKYQRVTLNAAVTDTDTTTVTWNFGDGSASATGTPVVHQFQAAGLTNVTATADDGKGGIGTGSIQLTIVENNPPVAAITTTPASLGNLFQNKTYTFAATASDPDASDTIASYEWDFGNGSVVAGSASQAHQFPGTVTGSVPVRVRAIDSRGAVGDWSPSVTFTVVATSVPTVTFVSTLPSTTMNTEVGSVLGATLIFKVAVTNPNGAAGTYLPLSSVIFTPGDSQASPAATFAGISNGDGTYTFTVNYKAAAVAGSRTAIPSVSAVTDAQGITGLPASGLAVTIVTQAANRPPVVTLISAPKVAAGPNATWPNVDVVFTGTAADPDNDTLTYAWDFGDGTVLTGLLGGSALVQTHKYAASATAKLYAVKLTADDGRTNGVKTADLTLNVLGNVPPTVVVTKTLPSGNPTKYQRVTLNAAVTDTDTTTVTWNFGDGSASATGNLVTHQFLAAGLTNVTATADDGKGGIGTGSIQLTIVENNPPVASVTTAPASLYQNKVYTFDATASDLDATDTIASYEWDFGDGVVVVGTGTQAHVFPPTVSGLVPVKARAIDSRGAVGDWSPAVTFTVVVTKLPVVAFTVGDKATFNATTAAQVIAEFLVSVTNPNGAAGTYLLPSDLTVTAGDSAGTVGTIINHQDGTYTIPVTYLAGAPARTVTPSVTALDGLQISSNVTVASATVNTVAAVNVTPVATLVSAPKIAAGTNATWTGVDVVFTATGSDPDSDPLVYTWEFGDGTVLTGMLGSAALTQTHNYTTAGNYSVKLTADDGRLNGTKTADLTLSVLANAAPTVVVTKVSPGGNPTKYQRVTLNAAVTDTDTTTVTWNFGDGSASATGTPVVHQFQAAGLTNVTATADDGKGGIGTGSIQLTIVENNPPVTTVTPTAPVSPLYQNKSYTFTATASDPDSDAIDSFEWDFGNGVVVAGGASQAHTFPPTVVGVVLVKARAIDHRGAVGDWSPVVNFTVATAQLPVVTFTSPAVSLSLNVGSYIDQDILFSVTNPNASLGATIPLPGGIAFSANDGAATVPAGVVSLGGTSYKATVRYSAAGSSGSRSNAPSASAQDSLSIPAVPVAVSGAPVTIVTGTFGKPTIGVTIPSTSSNTAYASASIALRFTLGNPTGNPTTYTVDWDSVGHPGVTTTSATISDPLLATTGVVVDLTHSYATVGTYKIAITAFDNRSISDSTRTADPQYRDFVIGTNALPTATITSPQSSGTLPALASIQNGGQGIPTIPAGATDPDVVVIPANGKLVFSGTGTQPDSGGAITYSWTFNGGVPNSSTLQSPGEVFFPGVASQITAYRVDLTVTDNLGRPSVNSAKARSKWVVVDASNTQDFHLSFMYRQKSDSNLNLVPTIATKAANGLGAQIQVFQDGVTNTWSVVDASGTEADKYIPVRSDLPFWIKIPSGVASDARAYFMRIPNAPTGAYADATLGSTLDTSTSSFGFASGSAPWNPALQIVTAQGFAPEVDAAAQRKLQGLYSLALPTPTTTADTFWLNRMSAPFAEGVITGLNGNAGFSGITAYQSFAEWPIVLEAKPTGATGSLTSTTGSTDLAFNLDYGKYQDDATTSASYGITAMQAFRAPKGSTDPYDLTVAGWGNASAKTTLTSTAAALGVGTYFGQMITASVGITRLTGGLTGLSIPYDANDPDRTVIAPSTRNLTGIRSVFSYAEYLWTKVWAWPLVLNSSQLKYDANLSTSTAFYRYSVPPTSWPKYLGTITPDSSSFNLNVSGGATFAPQTSSPVALSGTPGTAGVGRFFWTVYTPWYNSVPGSTIARTWLADASGQPPTTQSGSATGDATAALGFVPPQDTVVDKRGRNSDGSLSGDALGGYRVTWFNATKDEGGNPVPPDFWVVELVANGETRHFLLPGSFPATYPTYSPSGLPNPEAIAILTDARVAMTRQSDSKPIVAPGYCWFDVPLELRPAARSSATLTVFALKSVLANNAPTGARALNRPEWIDAIKTAAANMIVKGSNGTLLTDIYKIPFNYYWDIVITNGPATPVAP